MTSQSQARIGRAERPGHSRRPLHGGITEAGNDPKVAGLVYIAASLRTRVSRCLRSSRTRRLAHSPTPPQNGYLFLDREKFHQSFAADVSPDAAAFMADSQVPWGLDALNGAVTQPAWRTKPSWYLVATDDKMIPPDAQRAMSKRVGSTVVEVAGSHAVYVSQPQAVARVIAEATHGVAGNVGMHQYAFREVDAHSAIVSSSVQECDGERGTLRRCDRVARHELLA